jgi:hypothetical protein
MLTISEIASDAYAALGKPPSHWLHPRDLLRIVRRRLAFTLTTLSQGDQNHTVSKYEFTPTAKEHSLASIGNGSPAWMEYRVFNGETADSDEWTFVPTVNLDSLEDYRPNLAVAFYRDGATNQLKARFTYGARDWQSETTGKFRLWYDPDANVQKAMTDASGLPPNFNYLIADGTIIDAIGLMMNNVAGLEEGVSDMQVAAWREIQGRAADRLVGWERAFKEHKNRSRGAQRGRNRRPVLRNVIGYRSY